MDTIGYALIIAVIFLGPSALVVWSERRTNGPINPKAIKELFDVMDEARDVVKRLDAIEATMERMERTHQ